MSISYRNRHLYELHPASTRNFGVQAAALPSIHELDISFNHLRTLECPFAGTRGNGSEGQAPTQGFTRLPVPLVPLRPAVPPGPEPRSSSLVGTLHAAVSSPSTTTTATTSLEEEGSGLRSLTFLAKLCVCHNELRTLRGLCGAAHTLTTLIATHNHLTSLDGMQACQQLTYIDLSYNSIDSLQGLPLTCAAVHDVTGGVPASSHGGSATPPEQPPAPVHADPTPALSSIVVDTDTASVAFSCHTSPDEAHRLRLREAGRRSASANTSVQFQVDETSSASLSTPAALSPPEGSAAATAADAVETSRSHAAQSRATAKSNEKADPEVVLILSHNRLRGRALATLLWVDADDVAAGVSGDMGTRLAREGQVRSQGSGASLPRPWSTALTSLDLSYNYIEDVDDVRRLFSHVQWPVDGGAHVASAPLLLRLRRLDMSSNPCLVNGSLARGIVAALPSGSASARRGAAMAGEAASHATVTFRVHYDAPSLADALCSSATTFASLPAAQLAMEAALRGLAEEWRLAALRSPVKAATSTDHRPCSQATGETVVVLQGAEVTVLAAALQHRGARLGKVLRVPAAEADTTADVFMTPPPKWGSETAASTTFLQTSGFSGGSPPPRAPAAASSLLVGASSTTALSTAAVQTPGKPIHHSRQRSSAETSTLGYRLYQGRSAGGGGGGGMPQPSATPSLAPRPTAESSPVRELAKEAATTAAASTGSAGLRRSNAEKENREALSPSRDAVALQLCRAEVAVLRRRFRESQRKIRDQACVLQRHEATIHVLKAEVATAQQERDAAQQEVRRLQAEVRALRGEEVDDLSAERASALFRKASEAHISR